MLSLFSTDLAERVGRAGGGGGHGTGQAGWTSIVRGSTTTCVFLTLYTVHKWSAYPAMQSDTSQVTLVKIFFISDS